MSTTAPIKDKKISTNYTNILAGKGEEPSSFDFTNERNLREKKKKGYDTHYTYATEDGHTSFYQLENGIKKYYDQTTGLDIVIPGTEDLLFIDNLRDTKTVWSNNDCNLIDLGDGILNLEFHTKINTIGAGVLQGIQKGIGLAETEYKGLVISNNGAHFSAGANVGLIFMIAVEQ